MMVVVTIRAVRHGWMMIRVAWHGGRMESHEYNKDTTLPRSILHRSLSTGHFFIRPLIHLLIHPSVPSPVPTREPASSRIHGSLSSAHPRAGGWADRWMDGWTEG